MKCQTHNLSIVWYFWYSLTSISWFVYRIYYPIETFIWLSRFVFILGFTHFIKTNFLSKWRVMFSFHRYCRVLQALCHWWIVTMAFNSVPRYGKSTSIADSEISSFRNGAGSDVFLALKYQNLEKSIENVRYVRLYYKEHIYQSLIRSNWQLSTPVCLYVTVLLTSNIIKFIVIPGIHH